MPGSSPRGVRSGQEFLFGLLPVLLLVQEKPAGAMQRQTHKYSPSVWLVLDRGERIGCHACLSGGEVSRGEHDLVLNLVLAGRRHRTERSEKLGRSLCFGRGRGVVSRTQGESRE